MWPEGVARESALTLYLNDLRWDDARHIAARVGTWNLRFSQGPKNDRSFWGQRRGQLSRHFKFSREKRHHQIGRALESSFLVGCSIGARIEGVKRMKINYEE